VACLHTLCKSTNSDSQDSPHACTKPHFYDVQLQINWSCMLSSVVEIAPDTVAPNPWSVLRGRFTVLYYDQENFGIVNQEPLSLSQSTTLRRSKHKHTQKGSQVLLAEGTTKARERASSSRAGTSKGAQMTTFQRNGRGFLEVWGSHSKFSAHATRRDLYDTGRGL